MKKKGIGSVVAVSLLILLSLTLASIFLGYYLKKIGSATEDESALCLGIDVRVKDCFLFSALELNVIGNNFQSPELMATTDSGALVTIERAYGGGAISGLKLIFVDSSGKQTPVDPINLVVGPFEAKTEYSELVEFNSIEAAGLNLSFLDTSNPSSNLLVAAKVGKSKTVCQPTSPAFVCKRFGT